jgi:hypothetical protein
VIVGPPVAGIGADGAQEEAGHRHQAERRAQREKYHRHQDQRQGAELPGVVMADLVQQGDDGVVTAVAEDATRGPVVVLVERVEERDDRAQM